MTYLLSDGMTMTFSDLSLLAFHNVISVLTYG